MTDRLCPDCGKSDGRFRRGHCYRCWERRRKLGLPLPPSKRDNLDTRLAQAAGDPNDCWLWTGHIKEDGYGRGSHNGRLVFAHRAAYERAFGPIPAGHEIDHMCHNRDKTCDEGASCPHRRCVNPAHLEAVPHEVNIYRAREGRRECEHGDSAVVYLGARGHRRCQVCHRDAQRRYIHRRRRQGDGARPTLLPPTWPSPEVSPKGDHP